jgi:formate dehydrogenase accessory protein FdhE
VVGAVRDLVCWLPAVAPPRLREAAQAIRGMTAGEWRACLDSYRSRPYGGADQFSETAIFVLEAVLQPLAERLASAPQDPAAASAGRVAAPLPARASGGPVCPVCGGSPGVGVLREEGHGARRALVCGLCLTEWDYLRLVCAWCGEQRFESLPVFTADQFPHVRIEACDTCRTYLKTIDLTKDGRAVPVVDDIASISLDLWARDRGYRRLRASLVRT